MKLDREIACDASVLQLLDERGTSDYGHTILNFVDQRSRDSRLALANELGGSKQDIKSGWKRSHRFKKYPVSREQRAFWLFGYSSVYCLSDSACIGNGD